MTSPTPQQRPQRRWFQFSLRALLIVTAAAAGLAFAYVKLVEPYRLQREAIAAITNLGGTYKTEEVTGWIKYLDKNAQDVVVVDLADCDKPDEYLPHLVRLPRLRTLVIGGHSVGDEQVAALRRVESLKGLVLDSTLVTDEAVNGLTEEQPDLVVWKSERRTCAQLEKLGAKLRYDRPPSPPLSVTRLPTWLRNDTDIVFFRDPCVVVDLTACDKPDEYLPHLIRLPNLRTLLIGGDRVRDEQLRVLERIPSLRWLGLDSTFASDDGLQRLKEKLPDLLAYKNQERAMASLQKLGIFVRKFGVAGVFLGEERDIHFSQVEALRVEINHPPYLQRFKDADLVPLEHLVDLQKLVLTNTPVTVAGVKHIAGLPDVREVMAANTQVGDAGLAILVDLPKIESLVVSNAQITNNGLAHLKRSKTLRLLWIGANKITDEGIPHLEVLSNLKELRLVARLPGLSGLQKPSISPDGIKRLKQALPNCKIVHEVNDKG